MAGYNYSMKKCIIKKVASLRRLRTTHLDHKEILRINKKKM